MADLEDAKHDATTGNESRFDHGQRVAWQREFAREVDARYEPGYRQDALWIFANDLFERGLTAARAAELAGGPDGPGLTPRGTGAGMGPGAPAPPPIRIRHAVASGDGGKETARLVEIIPKRFRHDGERWLVDAYDVAAKADRSFAVEDIGYWQTAKEGGK